MKEVNAGDFMKELQDTHNNQLDDCIAGLVVAGTPLSAITIGYHTDGVTVISVNDIAKYHVIISYCDGICSVETRPVLETE